MKKTIAPPIEKIIDLSRFDDKGILAIKKAYRYACEAHRDQKRISGEPYIVHPLNVGIILANMGFDSQVVIAGLLHDTVEDTKTNLEDIRTRFGDEIAELVDGVTKISRIRSENIRRSQAENIRKMLFSMVKDIRVILIKLADKLHNMETLKWLDREKQVRIARETLDIYAPLAGRLGMARIKAELEDLALKYLEPDFYEDLKQYVIQRKEMREGYVEGIKKILQKEFARYGIRAIISGRAKHFYSIYRKMKDRDKSYDEILDLFAVRVITSSVKECYEVLGIVHRLWMPVRGRFKDYIAMPKSNMYQSLHTTVVGPEGKPLEIQIRTRKMNMIAEEGIAAHWIYKEGKRPLKRLERELTWINKLRTWQENMDNPAAFMEDLKKELLVDQIYVFTPKGDVIELPQGATPIDFAYKIHTEVGHHCIGAKVNDRIVPLRRPLKSCEVIQILTSHSASPSLEWLEVVKTSHARHKIRSYFSNTILRKEDGQGGETQKISTVHEPSRGRVKKPRVASIPKETRLYAQGEANVQMHIAKCCNPKPGDDIIGYITRGKGITVHRVDCKNLKAIRDYQKRKIAVEWEQRIKKLHTLTVISHDRSGLLMDLSTAIANANANIIELNLKVSKKGTAEAKFTIQVNDEQQLDIVMREIKSIPDVISISHK